MKWQATNDILHAIKFTLVQKTLKIQQKIVYFFFSLLISIRNCLHSPFSKWFFIAFIIICLLLILIFNLCSFCYYWVKRNKRKSGKKYFSLEKINISSFLWRIFDSTEIFFFKFFNLFIEIVFQKAEKTLNCNINRF